MFHSSFLNDAFNRLEQAASQFEHTIDAISEDIKALEKRLQDLKVPFEIEQPLRRDVPLTSSEKSRLNEQLGWDSGTMSEEHLLWFRDTKSGHFRLMYRRSYQPGEGVRLADFHIEPVMDERPLIETPASVRIQAHKALPGFVDKLTKACP